MELHNLKPIQTSYKGYLFRSRIEARYAVAFDHFGWTWEYEVQGYELPGGIRYLPDFILHGVTITNVQCHRAQIVDDVYVEVKPVYTQDARKKSEAMQQCGGNILVVGNIPDGATGDEVLRNMFKSTHLFFPGSDLCANALQCANRQITNSPKAKLSTWLAENKKDGRCWKWPNTERSFLWVGNNGEPVIGAWHTHRGRDDGDPQQTLIMFDVARKARFEHGETPNTPKNELNSVTLVDGKFDFIILSVEKRWHEKTNKLQACNSIFIKMLVKADCGDVYCYDNIPLVDQFSQKGQEFLEAISLRDGDKTRINRKEYVERNDWTNFNWDNIVGAEGKAKFSPKDWGDGTVKNRVSYYIPGWWNNG